MTSTDADVAAQYGLSVDEEAAGIAEPWNTDRGGIDAIGELSEWTGKAVAWLTLPLMGVLVFEAIRRSLFDVSTQWAQDVAYMLYATHFLVGAAYTLKNNGHIRTDFLYRNWPPRRQATVDALLYGLVFIPVMLLALKVSFDFAWRSFQQREGVIQSAWQGPIWPLKAMMPLGIGLWTLQSISELVKSIRVIRSGGWEPSSGA